MGIAEGLAQQTLVPNYCRTCLTLKKNPSDRAYRSLRARPRERDPPWPFIIGVHYYHVRDQILHQAGEASPLLYRGKRLSIFPDFTASVAKIRVMFGNTKRLLHTCPGVKFGLFFPAELRISHYQAEHFTSLTTRPLQLTLSTRT